MAASAVVCREPPKRLYVAGGSRATGVGRSTGQSGQAQWVAVARRAMDLSAHIRRRCDPSDRLVERESAGPPP